VSYLGLQVQKVVSLDIAGQWRRRSGCFCGHFEPHIGTLQGAVHNTLAVGVFAYAGPKGAYWLVAGPAISVAGRWTPDPPNGACVARARLSWLCPYLEMKNAGPAIATSTAGTATRRYRTLPICASPSHSVNAGLGSRAHRVGGYHAAVRVASPPSSCWHQQPLYPPDASK